MRAVALKVPVSELLSGEFKPSESEYDPAYVVAGEKKINRCNVVGTIVSESPLLLDDGTGEIRLLPISGCEAKEREVVRVIGKARERDGERLISAETIKPVALEWLELRKLELSKAKQREESPEIEELEV